MQTLADKAEKLLNEWRGDQFIFGIDVIKQIPEAVKVFGKSYFLVYGKTVEDNGQKYKLDNLLNAAGFVKLGETVGATPNSPDTDVTRVADELNALPQQPDFIISFGGGSLIDAVKASLVLYSLGGECEDYYGVDKVSAKLTEQEMTLIPQVAIMTSSASAAHLTKYSNVTNFETIQKKLIIDQAVVPALSVFDYALTDSMGYEFTITGALDGLSHLTEVYMGFDMNTADFSLIERATLVGLELILTNLKKVLDEPGNLTARQNIGLATDLGGLAIMYGSTNGPHLNSFSLVDLMDHGQAVGLLNPYYAYFFAQAIPEKLQRLCEVLKRHEFIDQEVNLENVNTIGTIYADAIRKFVKSFGYPTTLGEIKGFKREHFDRVLEAAKNPQLKVKLQAMPIPMNVDDIDEFMSSIIDAATGGDLSKIKLKPTEEV